MVAAVYPWRASGDYEAGTRAEDARAEGILALSLKAGLARAALPYGLDTSIACFYTDGMEVNLSPDLEAKLNRKAAQQGRDSQSLVQEAVERMVSYDEWFVREVEKGLAAADRSEFVEHEEVGKLIDSRYPG